MGPLHEQLVATAKALHNDQLTVANSGNVSVRYEGGFLITPSGVDYQSLRTEDIVYLHLEGNVLAGHLKPSSEWRFHADLYHSRDDIEAIVHTHSIAATALASLRQPLPAFHYMVALAGGNKVPCSDYATFGTQALSDAVVTAMHGYKACLMANHGLLATGNDLIKAYRLAQELESLCQSYLSAKAIAEPVLLSDDEMLAAALAFEQYGQKSIA